MGARHSQLVERLKADIESTHARLKKYLGDGVEHVNGKVAILEERETALTERLLEMAEAQYQMLKEQAEQVHASKCWAGGWLCGAHRARASAATTRRLHAYACEGADENSWQSSPRHARAGSASAAPSAQLA